MTYSRSRPVVPNLEHRTVKTYRAQNRSDAVVIGGSVGFIFSCIMSLSSMPWALPGLIVGILTAASWYGYFAGRMSTYQTSDPAEDEPMPHFIPKALGYLLDKRLAQQWQPADTVDIHGYEINREKLETLLAVINRGDTRASRDHLKTVWSVSAAPVADFLSHIPEGGIVTISREKHFTKNTVHAMRNAWIAAITPPSDPLSPPPSHETKTE